MPSGGKRRGAGRPSIGLSEKQIKKLLLAFKKRAHETGKDAFDLLAEIAYDNTAYELTGRGGKTIVKIAVPVAERRRAIEVFATLTITKRSETTVENKFTGPVIGLPPLAEPKEDDIRVSTKTWTN